MTIAAGSTPVSALFRGALGHHQAGLSEQAEQGYREVISRNPRHIAAHANLGVLCATLGRVDEAADYYQKALQISPSDPETLVNFGNLELVRGNIDRAEYHYRSAHEANPRSAAANASLGKLLARLADRKRYPLYRSRHLPRAQLVGGLPSTCPSAQGNW